MAVVDGVYVIIWLSAFATQAAYNSADQCGKACGLSKAVVAMAFFVTCVTSFRPVSENIISITSHPYLILMPHSPYSLFFGGTLALSILTLRYYNEHHTLPGYQNFEMGSHTQNIDPDKAAFNPTMGPSDEEYAPVGMHDDTEGPYRPGSPSRKYDPYAHNDTTTLNEEYGGQSAYGGSSTAQGDPYGRTGSVPPVNPFDDQNLVDPYSRPQGGQSPAGGRIYAPPAAAEEYNDGPASFPAGNYDRGLR